MNVLKKKDLFSTVRTKYKLKKYSLKLELVIIISLIVLFSQSTIADEKSTANKVADSLSYIMNMSTESRPSIDSTITLDEYLKIAMSRNPDLRSVYNQWIADLQKSNYIGSLPDPMFSYGYFIENVETRVGPQEQKFSLRQSFPWFGTLGAKEDIAFAMSQASYQKFEATRLKLFYQVKSAFYDFYYLGQDQLITYENLELLKFWESVARSKYKVGLKQHPDVIKAQVELGKLEDHMLTLKEKQKPAATRLLALLDLPEIVELPIPTNITIDESQLIEDSVLNVIKLNNPDLLALQNIIESKRAGERLASKQSLPSFSIGVDYIQTGEALNPDMNESGKDPWVVGAKISLPIWFGKNSARKKEAKARRLAAEYKFDNTENKIRVISKKIMFEYSDALRKLKLYRDGLVPKAQQSLNASYAAYQAGEADFLYVLDAQRQLLNFQLTIAKEKARFGVKRAQLEMLSGKNLDNYLQR